MARNLRMPQINSAEIAGNITRDPEIKYTKGGMAVCSMTVAVTEHFKRKDGTKDEKTAFVHVVSWDRVAEYCGEHLRKGDPVLVVGKIAQEKDWQDQDGKKRQGRTHIAAMRIQPLAWPGDDDGARGASSGRTGGRQAASSAQDNDEARWKAQGADIANGTADYVGEDDIPF